MGRPAGYDDRARQAKSKAALAIYSPAVSTPSSRRNRQRRAQRWGFAIATLAVLLACGARTGLVAPEELDASPVDAGKDVHDAGIDAFDADADAAEEDALPLIDVNIDVPVFNECPDAGSTLIYVITSQNELFSFYPPTLAFKKIGNIACKSSSTPFSMAVDRLGTAYSVFSDGNLFQISTANAACKSTTFAPNQLGWQNFGMGYSADSDGGETLYVVEVDFQTPSKGLGDIDTQTFKLNLVGTFQPALTPECELTGTGDGRLFALCLPQNGTGSTLAQIDPATAKVIGANSLKVGGGNQALAFAFWGGDFWIFTSPGNTTTVTQYDPQTQSEKAVTTLGSTIVGAGVSTCAPAK